LLVVSCCVMLNNHSWKRLWNRMCLYRKGWGCLFSWKRSLETSVLFLSAWTIVIENPSGGPTMGQPAQRCCIMKPRQGNSHKSIVLKIYNEMVRTKILGTYKICSWRIVVEWGLNSRKSSFQSEKTNAWMFIKKKYFGFSIYYY